MGTLTECGRGQNGDFDRMGTWTGWGLAQKDTWTGR